MFQPHNGGIWQNQTVNLNTEISTNKISFVYVASVKLLKLNIVFSQKTLLFKKDKQPSFSEGKIHYHSASC